VGHRYRLQPTPAQEATLLEHCAHARLVYNLGQEQRAAYRPGRRPPPGYLEQCRQLTEARAAEPWLAAGSVNLQQQALRDLDQAWRNFFAGTHRRPGFRKKGRHEGFRIAGWCGEGQGCSWDVRRLSRKTGEVRIPKIGYVRFRWTRAIPECKSYRVTLDCSGRWHVAFAAIPEPLDGPGTGEIVGIDRGVAVSLALSTGETRKAPSSSCRIAWRQRALSRAKPGSNRRQQAKLRLAKAYVQDTARRKDWAEKASTDIARRFDLIRIEDLNIRGLTRSAKGTAGKPGKNVRQKAGLNRAILAQGWGLFARRLEDKAPGRVEKINPAYTSRRCSACGHVDRKSRKSQADFWCTACGYALNADVNAAINIAAGYAVNARGADRVAGAMKREPLAGAA